MVEVQGESLTGITNVNNKTTNEPQSEEVKEVSRKEGTKREKGDTEG